MKSFPLNSEIHPSCANVAGTASNKIKAKRFMVGDCIIPVDQHIYPAGASHLIWRGSNPSSSPRSATAPPASRKQQGGSAGEAEECVSYCVLGLLDALDEIDDLGPIASLLFDQFDFMFIDLDEPGRSTGVMG
jgi:hypothetical protein